MFSLKRIRWYTREWVAAALFLALVAVGVSVYRPPWRSSRYRLAISAGSVNGLRHLIAMRLKDDAAVHGLILSIEGTKGSVDTLNLVDAGQLNLALVQGGLDSRFHPHVRQVAALYVEPLHLLVKTEIHAQVSAHLTALKGMRVNVGEVGSGTRELAIDVLRFAGLVPRRGDGEGDYRAETMDYDTLLTKRADQLPDAIFTVSALPSPLVRSLSLRNYQLVSLPFGAAYVLDALNRRDLRSQPVSSEEANDVAKVHIYPAQIPAFTYGLDPPMPTSDLSTFGPRLLMVAHEDVPQEAIRRVLETMFSPPFAQISKPTLDAKLLETPSEYPLHPGTNQYLEHNKPMLAGDVIDILEKACSLAGAIIGASFFLWQWTRQRYRRKRDLGFETYMMKVAAIEERAFDLEMDAHLDIAELLRLQRELVGLKNQALGRFAEGKLQGGEFLSGFVSHVNEARNYLNRLILHQRENLEDRAIHENRPTEAVWIEALGGWDSGRLPQPPGQSALDESPQTGQACAVVDRSDDVGARRPGP
jgi:TRAP-type uncharacterized transport system substrate-binding protein